MALDDETPTWTRELTDAELRAASSGWPDYNSGKRHPFSTSTGMEGGCDTCNQLPNSPLHERPWEPPRAPTSAPISTTPPHMTDTSFEAREKRLRALPRSEDRCSCERGDKTIFNCWSCDRPNPPAVSTTTGGEPEKEIPMKMTITVNITELPRIVPVFYALNDIDGVTVESMDAVPEDKEAPQEPSKSVRRNVATDARAIRQLLREALELRVPVKLDYTTEAGVLHHNREVMPLSFEDDLLIARDPMRNNEMRSFKLANMSRVER